jgi:hypothetical protein
MVIILSENWPLICTCMYNNCDANNPNAKFQRPYRPLTKKAEIRNFGSNACPSEKLQTSKTMRGRSIHYCIVLLHFTLKCLYSQSYRATCQSGFREKMYQ